MTPHPSRCACHLLPPEKVMVRQSKAGAAGIYLFTITYYLLL